MNEKKYKRIFAIVIDSLGVGEMPDAASYGDAGTDTLGHIAENVEELKIPNLQNPGRTGRRRDRNRTYDRLHIGRLCASDMWK